MSSLEQLQLIRQYARDEACYAALVSLFEQRTHGESDSPPSEDTRSREVLDQQTELICRYLPDTTLTFVNEAYCRFYEKRREELIGQKFLQLLVPGVRENVRRSIQRYAENPSIVVDEKLVYRRNGDTRLIQWMRQPIFDAQGRLVEIQSVGRDVTGQQEAVGALDDIEASYRRLLDAWPEGVIVTHQTAILYANPAMVRLMGAQKPGDLVGKTVFDLLHPDYHDLIRERIETMGHDHEQAVRRHERYMRLDGTAIDVEISLIPYELGHEPRTITFVQDVTHHKQTEDALHDFQDRLRTLHQLGIGLSSVRTLDAFCLQAVEMGRTQLGIDRLGLWFLTEEGSQFIGSYGTDSDGQTVDERAIVRPVKEIFRGRFLNEHQYLYFEDSIDLADAHGNTLGQGWNALVALWNGDEVIGYLSADNLLSGIPASSYQLELLVLYGSTLGHLATRIRAEEALRASEEAERQFQNQLRVLHDVNMELTLTTSFRDLCQRAVELGHSRLGFDRIGLWFRDEQNPDYMRGAFGLDERGVLRDESSGRLLIKNNSEDRLTPVILSGEAAVDLLENTALFDHQGNVVGQGWVAAAGLMDGTRIIGCLYIDNLVSKRPPERYTLELLRLYGVTLGHLAVRKWAEEALRQSEKRYRAIFEEAGIGICVIDAAGYPVSFNPVFQRMLGYTSEELHNLSLIDITFEEDKEISARQFDRLMAGEILQYKLEKRYILKDGSLRWVRLNASQFPGSEPDEHFVVSVVEDIDDQKQAEAQLRESEARNRALREAIPDLIFLYTADGRFVDYHQPHERYLLIQPENFLGKFYADVLPPEIVRAMRPHFETVVSTGQMQSFEYSLEFEGTTRFFESRLSMYGEQRVLSIVRDVTERKAAEDQLRESEARFRQIADHVDEAFFIHEQTPGKLLYVNPAIEKILQRPLTEILADGMPLYRYIYQDDLSMLDAFLATVALGEKSDIELRIVHPDGTLRWIWLQIFPIRDNHRRVYRSAGIMKDITERKQMERQNLELSLQHERVRIISDFVRDASHQFRTPLSVINSKVYLAGKLDDPDARSVQLRGIQEQSENILKLVESLVSMSRLDSDVALSMTPIDLNQMLQAVHARHTGGAAENGLDLVLETTSGLPSVRADVDELYMAVAHLLENAIRYTPTGGRITLRSSLVGASRVAIVVEDTGRGIPANELSHVFDRFYRGQIAYGTAGFGLGLAMVKKIVERHGGYVEVQSQLDKGSAFTLLLPAYFDSLQPEAQAVQMIRMA